MKETLEVIIKNLVDNTDKVEIKEVEGEKTIIFEVKVAEEDMGKIIGRQGKIAQSIRTVMRAVANKKDKKVTVEFIGERKRYAKKIRNRSNCKYIWNKR